MDKSNSFVENADSEDSTDLKACHNTTLLDDLQAILSSTKSTSDGDANSIAANAESSVALERFVSRLQAKDVDDAMLLQLEELAYRGNVSASCRRQIVGIIRHTFVINFPKGNEQMQEENAKQVIIRNLDSCLECATAEAAKRETTGFDALIIASFLSVILLMRNHMRKYNGPFLEDLLDDRHRDTFRLLAASLKNDYATHKELYNSVRRIAVQWGLTKELRHFWKRTKNGGGGGGGGVDGVRAGGGIEIAVEAVSSKTMKTDSEQPMVEEQTESDKKQKLGMTSEAPSAIETSEGQEVVCTGGKKRGGKKRKSKNQRKQRKQRKRRKQHD